MTTGNHPTLSQALDDYLRLRRARFAPTTVQNEAFVLKRFVANVGDIQVRHLKPDHVERWFYGPNGVMADHVTRDGRRREQVQPSTHNYYRNRLKSFFTYCSSRDLTRASLLQQVTPMAVPVRERLQPGREMLWAMLESAECPRDRAILAVAMNTGLRRSSLRDLRVGDVDLDTLTLHVRIAKSKLEDSLPMTADLHDELKRWLIRYRTDCAECPARPVQVTSASYLFPGSWRPDRPTGKLHEVVHRALESAGLPTSHEGVHTIRRAVARLYFDDLVAQTGYDGALRQVSSLLHHSNSTTTERYLGLTKERLARDDSLRGRSLLGPRPSSSDNVVALPGTATRQ